MIIQVAKATFFDSKALIIKDFKISEISHRQGGILGNFRKGEGSGGGGILKWGTPKNPKSA